MDPTGFTLGCKFRNNSYCPDHSLESYLSVALHQTSALFWITSLIMTSLWFDTLFKIYSLKWEYRVLPRIRKRGENSRIAPEKVARFSKLLRCMLWQLNFLKIYNDDAFICMGWLYIAKFLLVYSLLWNWSLLSVLSEIANCTAKPRFAEASFTFLRQWSGWIWGGICSWGPDLCFFSRTLPLDT